MLREKEVVVEIDENGNCSIEAVGFVGPACEKVVNEIVAELGTPVNVQRKREYWQATRSDNRVRSR